VVAVARSSGGWKSKPMYVMKLAAGTMLGK
jgi:hypothetical protein